MKRAGKQAELIMGPWQNNNKKTEKAQALKYEPSEEKPLPENSPDRKPFSGGLAILKIQPFANEHLKTVIKSENKFPPSQIIVNIQPEKIEEISYVSPPQMHKLPDVKPKLEHFTGHVQSLSIRPIEIPDIKPQRREKKFTCYLCQKGVGTKGGLLYHMKAHLNGRPFKCKICKRSYSTKNDFDTHNKRHAGTKFTCDFCNRNFATKQYLADHISALHLPKVLKCHFCKEDRYFSAVKALKVHQLQGHLVASMSGQNNIYSCTMGCGYRTASRQSFELHELHAKQMKFKCITCLQIFSCRKLLSAHMKTEKKSLVECKICKGSFKDIRYHMTKFHSKSNICDFCNFETKCATMFSNHIRQCASQDMLRSRGHLYTIILEAKNFRVDQISRDWNGLPLQQKI